MKHIGFNEQTCKLLKIFLSDRKQYTEINSKNSDLLLVGNKSVFKGSMLSAYFYNIFSLDLLFTAHDENHNSHFEYYKCSKPFHLSYIDDLFAVVEGNYDNIWTKISNYVKNMKEYYTSNKLR